MKYYIFVDFTSSQNNEDLSKITNSIDDLTSSLKNFRHTYEQINLAEIEGNLNVYFEVLGIKCECNLVEGIFISSSTSKHFNEIDIKKIPFPSYFIFYNKEKDDKFINSRRSDALFLWKKRYFLDNYSLSFQVCKEIPEVVECILNIKNSICQKGDLFLAGHPDFSIWFECIPKIPPYISSILWGVYEGVNDDYIKSFFDDPSDEEKESTLEEESVPEIKKEIGEQDNVESNVNNTTLNNVSLDKFFWKVPETKREIGENSDISTNPYDSNVNNTNINTKISKWDIKNVSVVKTKLGDLFEVKQGEITKVKEHFIPLHSKKPFPMYDTETENDIDSSDLDDMTSHHLELISFGSVNQILNIKVFQPRFELKCKKLSGESEVLLAKKVVMYFKHVASGEYGFIQATKLFNDEIRMYASFFDYNNKKFVLNGKPIEHTMEYPENNAIWGTSNIQNYERQCWLTISSFRNECYKIYRFLLNSEKTVKLKNYIKLMKEHAKIIGMTEEYNKFLKKMVSTVLPENPGNLPAEHYNLLKNLSSHGIYSPEIDC
uniref:VWFA domain-containing protein n=1 Tax=Strongyloides stercoralis TaxID=6248 RepID=A0A0K0EQ63_STRER